LLNNNLFVLDQNKRPTLIR